MRNKSLIKKYYKKQGKVLSIIFSSVLMMLVISFSYAFFSYNRTGLYTQAITGGKIMVSYQELAGNNILIENSYPRTNEEALTYGLEFDFIVKGYNESKRNVYYAIEMDYGDDLTNKNRFLDTDMKLSLYENDEVVFENEIFNNLDNHDIHYGYISQGTSEEVPTINNYKLRIWINDYVIISDTLKDNLEEWIEADVNWLRETHPKKYVEIMKGTSHNLSDYGMKIYTSDEFANSYANFKVNIRADLNYKDTGYLTYDANGGKFAPDKTSLLTGMITMQKPAMENKGFLGWSSNPNALVPEYYSGDYYNGGERVLYAVYDDKINVMGELPSPNTADITEIIFINDTQINIDERYSNAIDKIDLTHPDFEDLGNVKGWIEDDIFYIGSEGTTYLSTGNKLFNGWMGLTNIDFTNVDTVLVTDMSCMFGAEGGIMEGIGIPSGLSTLDLSGFNTSNVTNMSGMFEGVAMLSNLDISSFDTSNVYDMTGMFADCISIERLDLSNFNTSKVISMASMFANLMGGYFMPILKQIDLSSFDTSSVRDMSYMFSSCYSLESLDLSSFNTSNVENMTHMFNYCDSLTSLDLSSFNTSKVIDMSNMFSGCTQIANLNISSFDTSLVTDMSFMFYMINKLSELNLNHFNTSNVESMNGMFWGCNVKYLYVDNFDTSKVTDMYGMFSQIDVTELDLTSFSVNNVTKFDYMFMGCEDLKIIYANSDWNIGKYKTSTSMFSGCYNLKGAITYSGSAIDKNYANPNTGYFTIKNN